MSNCRFSLPGLTLIVGVVIATLAGQDNLARISYVAIQSAGADEKALVRIYRLNNKKQMIRNRWVKKSERAGCHDLRGTKKAYRVAQTGFAWCTVYAAGDCAAGTELGAKWRGAKYRRAEFDPEEPQTRILEGSNWYLSEEENVQVGSWRCEYE